MNLIPLHLTYILNINGNVLDQAEARSYPG